MGENVGTLIKSPYSPLGNPHKSNPWFQRIELKRVHIDLRGVRKNLRKKR